MVRATGYKIEARASTEELVASIRRASNLKLDVPKRQGKKDLLQKARSLGIKCGPDWSRKQLRKVIDDLFLQ